MLEVGLHGYKWGNWASAHLAMELTAVLTRAEEGAFVALNPETGTTTQGETIDEAVANLKEATALYLSGFPLTAGDLAVIKRFSISKHA